MVNLSVAIIQTELKWDDIDENLLRFTEKLNQVSDTDLIILPEMFSTGFTMNAKLVAERESGKAVNWLIKMATSKNTAITGSLVIEENGNYYKVVCSIAKLF